METDNLVILRDTDDQMAKCHPNEKKNELVALMKTFNQGVMTSYIVYTHGKLGS